MTYQSAKHRVTLKRVMGLVVLIVYGTVFLVSLIKLWALGVANGNAIPESSSSLLGQVFEYMRTATKPLSSVWIYAPVPTEKYPLAMANFLFVMFYCGVFVGIGIIQSADYNARRIDKQVEDEFISASIRGSGRKTREQTQRSIDIETGHAIKAKPSIFLAPAAAMGLVGICIITMLQ